MVHHIVEPFQTVADPGQQVASGESIAEIKVLDQYKVHTSLSEYYIP